MIGYLRGRLFKKAADVVLLDVGGVGYELRIPLSTFREIEGLAEDSTVELFVHTHVREDALELFGFWSEGEKVLFEKLIGVSGIGPRLAQAALSGMDSDELLTALANSDVARLTRISGVGKRMAERMVVDLREVARTMAAEKLDTERQVQRDLVQALVNLGYREPEAQRAVAQAQREIPDGSFQDLLRVSLKGLSRA